MPSLNCSPPVPIKFGVGHSRLRGPANWTTMTCTHDRYLQPLCRRLVDRRARVGRTGRTGDHEACAKQQIARDQLTIDADNGGPMIAKLVTSLMTDVDVSPDHSRPHVSTNNPFSEAQFKTLKYQPDYPDRFGSPRCADVGADILAPGQHRAPSQRDWLHHPCRHSLWSGLAGSLSSVNRR